MPKITEQAARLLTSSIESVERLDILLHLRADAQHSFTANAVSATLHLPSPATEQHLAILCGRGLLTVNIGTDLRYSYKPISPAVEEVIAQLAELNRHHRAELAAVLAAASDRDPVRNFANAFLVRKTGDGA